MVYVSQAGVRTDTLRVGIVLEIGYDKFLYGRSDECLNRDSHFYFENHPTDGSILKWYPACFKIAL